MEKEKHLIAVAHFEQALEAHHNGHVDIFPDVTASQHIAIPADSAWLMLQVARRAEPREWMYRCDEPYVRLGSGGLTYTVTEESDFITCRNNDQRWMPEGDDQA